MDSFGTVLKKYRREKNMTQLDVGDVCTGGHSVISRIENEVFLPCRHDMEQIGRILKLNDEEFEYFKGVYAADVMNRQHLHDYVPVSINRIIEDSENDLSTLRTLRRRGQPQLAVSATFRRTLTLVNNCNSSKSKGYTERLNNLAAEILMETSKSYMDYLSPTESLEKIDSIIDLQKKVAFDKSSNLFVDVSREAAYYVAQDTKNAHLLGEVLFKNVKDLKEDWRIEVYRAYIVNFAQQFRTKSSVLRVINEIVSLMEDIETFQDPLQQAFLLEGIIRAKGYVRDDSFLDDGEKVASLINSANEPSPLKRVQLGRSLLMAMKETEFYDQNLIQKIVIDSLNLCREYQYKRYEKQIVALRQQLLR